jgi:deoxyribonuclease V
MDARHLHDWNISYAEARQLQGELAGMVEVRRFRPGETFIVAGLDCAFTAPENRFHRAAQPPPAVRGGPNQCIAVIVVMRIGQGRFEVIETASAIEPVTFPYIPGLLTFREAPACIAAAKKIKAEPDFIMIDGQGIAHPRRFGIAAHLGVLFERPTIGCAKSRLIGEYNEPGKRKGSFSELTDDGEVIGAVLRTRTAVKPVYVSIGNKVTLEDAIELTMRSTDKYRIPEPTRIAHQLVTKEKKKLTTD